MRILVVGYCFPWPADTGSRMRLARTISALSTIGEVDLFALVADPATCSVPPGAPIQKVKVVARPKPGFTPARRVPWLVWGKDPIELVGRDFRAVREAFRSWARPPYDVTWFQRVESYVALGGEGYGRVVVDFDDLEDQKILGRLRAMQVDGADLSPVRRWGIRVQGRKNLRLWRQLHRKVSASVDAVSVCSQLDRRRLPVPNAVVVPNGLDRPQRAAGRVSVRRPPTVLFQGFLVYLPNADAARFLATRVGPLIRARLPEVRIRLVGRDENRLAHLNDPPRVEVAGWVPDLFPELAGADLVAVPIRFGSGTRLKVLEAFAHRIPVVSTTVGVEGIDVVPGKHLLVADTAEEFAAACVELLTDEERRAALADAAYELFLEQYEASRVADRIRSFATA